MFLRKMRPLRILLLLLTICQIGTSIPIFDGDDGASFHSRFRSARFGETIQEWFRTIKSRVVEQWQKWFGPDSSTPNLSPQDILNIDKVIENRVQGYPGFFLDLSRLSLDPKQDWGFQVGNWYIIRKVTGNKYNPDSDSDEWDIKPLMPPLIPKSGIDWTFNEVEGSDSTRSPTTTPKIRSTTFRPETPQSITQTPSFSTFTGSVDTTTESDLPITQLITTSGKETVNSTKEILTSTEFIVTSTEPVDVSAESIVPISKLTVTSTAVPIITTPISSTESTLGTTKSLISTESTIIYTEPGITTESTATSTEPLIITIESTATSTKPVGTSTELILSTLDKRVEDNKTDNKSTKKPKNHSASAEVIMF